ncbi:MAG: SDR family oxidoreductase [Candidatus Abyssobacteria bacterium SURF_5]|uniref:SDR family oxidoreductase n=1 Tax=Abyssobacteria bacterium (strain SURF_5) TaxID=2093360 RepID=A0A3A4NMX2_ABYX5|nr:MAG: SDR family oxidoreductase [Candidatus Abyssubacteria bacterium SURF_5]
MSKIDFTGRVAIVTGAGSGLGRTYALELAKRGAKVVVNDLGGARDGTGSSDAAANQVAEEIKAAGGEAIPNYDSVATVAGGENIVKSAVEAFGKVDIVVNNAGILRDKSFLKMDENMWDAVVAVHLKGAYCVSRPAMEIMRKQNYGRIVMTSSTSGLIGNFGQANYGAAKMGLAGLTNVLKKEGAKYNIKVNVIVPNALTRMTEDILPPGMQDVFKTENVTPAVVYLCSEQCEDSGRYIVATGTPNGILYCRSQVMTGPGKKFDKVPAAEDIMQNWGEITNLNGARFCEEATELFMG